MPEKVKVGKVEHYYDKIGVAAVVLEDEVAIGDMLVFKQGSSENEQKVTSMQINHINVEKGFKGDSVGIKVDAPVDEGSDVYKEL
ncbi:MAG: translation elongation factor-like protein [Candidatus Micrarchaeia archaeon]